jgi:cytochrome c2
MRPGKALGWAMGAALAAASVGYAINYAQARKSLDEKAVALTGGDSNRGKLLIASYGCGGCHSVSGVPQAAGKVGPTLSAIGSQAYLAGRLENRPDNLIRWIADPRGIDPQTAMPSLGVKPADARDIAAYLYTLG